MRILVNDIAASKTGAMSVLKEFYHYIIENDKENEWIFLLSDKYFTESNNVKIVVRKDIKSSWIKKFIFDFFTGKKYINSFNPDVVFSMQNIITFGLKVPQCLYVHQSLPYTNMKRFSLLKKKERESAIYQKYIGKIIDISIKKSDKVIVQTKWMKEAIINKLSIPESKIINIMPTIENLSNYQTEDAFDNTCFFYPTSKNVYKNNDIILKACEILEKDESVDNYKVSFAMTNPNFNTLSPKIEILGRLSREKMIEMYNKTTLIFPSYVETVGLPMLEAKMLGTIVLASDCPFSHELLDGYENAYFFNPFCSHELAKLMKKVICGDITKTDEQKYILDKNNSWGKVVKEVISLESIIYN